MESNHLQSRQNKSHREETVTLVKAQPHPGSKYGETVCCAGVTIDREWRRHYPIKLRTFSSDAKFKRWQWISYEYRLPSSDSRWESRWVQEESIIVGKTIPVSERADFLRPIVHQSTDDAASDGNSLALIEAHDLKLTCVAKPEDELRKEKRAFELASSQLSFFKDENAGEYEPCPVKFNIQYKDGRGKSHRATCEDWETVTTYQKLSLTYGHDGAVDHLVKTYTEVYPERGFVFAMGTHSRRSDQWLLVGVIRLDETDQGSFL